MRTALLTAIAAACFFTSTSCHNQQEEFTDKQFVIANKETVKIKELDLSITNNGCGREWVGDMEKPFCELLIKAGDSSFTAGSDFKPLRFRNIEIEIATINPWGKMEDSIPPGGCSVWVRRRSEQ